MITICLVHFKSLGLANLEAALYSVLQQDFAHVHSLIVVDNDSDQHVLNIEAVIKEMNFPLPVRLLSFKHGDNTKTHAWSANAAVREVITPWVFFTRSDYLLRFDMLDKCAAVISSKGVNWSGFIVGNGCHLDVDVGVCEATSWRQWGPDVLKTLPHVEFDYTVIDSGVWLTRRDAFNAVGGLDEMLTAWGHSQTLFQYKMYQAGVEFVRIPETLYYHPQHSAPRDIALAHQQLKDQGVNIKNLWARYEGVKPY